MFLEVSLLIFGLVIVGTGAHFFVDASIDIAARLHIPRVVIGGTIVSLATTMPEATVSVTASAMGDSGIAIGNAVGSAIANIGMIVGAVALITRVAVEPDAFNRRARWMLVATVLVIALSWSLAVSRLGGMILALVAVSYLVSDLIRIMRQPRAADDNAACNGWKSNARMAGAFLFGAALVLTGSRVLVESGVAVAATLGVSSAVIGLSVIAVGTSLPELVTGVVAARKGVPDLSLGNMTGCERPQSCFDFRSGGDRQASDPHRVHPELCLSVVVGFCRLTHRDAVERWDAGAQGGSDSTGCLRALSLWTGCDPFVGLRTTRPQYRYILTRCGMA